MMKTHDLALLDRWRRERDAEAFRELVVRHGGMVFATCCRILGNASEAEDVTQDCFVQLAARPARPKVSVGGWLHALATHRALDRIRGESRRRAREKQFGTPPEGEPRGDLLEHVDEALADIDDDLQALLVLHFFEGRNHDEIARDLGVSRSTVTRRMAQGVEEVRARLRTKGIAIPAAGLGLVLAELQAEALPVGTATVLGKIAIAGGGAGPVAVGAGAMAAKLGVLAAVALLSVGGFFAWWRAPESRPVAAQVNVAEDAHTVDPAPLAEERDASGDATVTSAVSASTTAGEANVVVTADDAVANARAVGALVEGVVLDLRGHPVANARVDCYGGGRDFPGSTQIFTGDDGRFRYEDVPPTDLFRVYASADAPRRRSQQVQLERIGAGERYDMVLTVQEGAVSGRVVDEAGRPVAGAKVMAQPVETVFYPIPMGDTDGAGRFSVGGLPAGEYVLKPNWPGGKTPWPHDGVHVTLRGDETRDGFRLTLGPEEGVTIAGRVTDGDGAGIYDVHVEAHLPDPPYTSQWARSDMDGYFAIGGLSEGQYMLRASHVEYGDGFARDIAAGTDDVMVRMESCGAIDGVVVDAVTGLPVRSFEVLDITRVSGVGVYTTESFRAVEDAQGRFVLTQVGPGEAPVRVRAAGYAEWFERVEVPAGGVAEAVVALKRSRVLRGEVRDAGGTPIAGAMVFAGKLPDDPERAAVEPVRTGTNGEFVFESLDPDERLITCYHPQFAPGFVEVGESDAPVEIVLAEGVTLRGRVSVDGEPAQWAHVSVFYPQWSGNVRGHQVNEDGMFTLEGMARGDGIFNVSVQGFGEGVDLHVSREWEVEAGPDSVTLDVDVHHGTGVVEGVVYEAGRARGGLYMMVRFEDGGGWSRRYTTHASVEDGRYRIEGLPAGEGVVVVYPVGAPEDRGAVEVAVVVGEGEVVRCDVEIEGVE